MTVLYPATSEGMVRAGLDQLVLLREKISDDKIDLDINAYREILSRRLSDDYIIWRREAFRLHRRHRRPYDYIRERRGEP